ncbi:hypothetical protein [Corynebacterium sp. LK2510]|uniref:hypothetical protein n=1 Tax=Corynebacterium sp. LK2510 TaxID=3110472 RepID=UPI0034CE1FF9
MESKDAHEALEAVRDVESRATPAPSLVYIALPSALLGLAVFFVLQEQLLWALLFGAATVLSAFVAPRKRRGVRYAMKQPIGEDPQFSWTSLLPFLFTYALIAFVPKGDPYISAAAGLAATGAAATLLWREGR